MPTPTVKRHELGKLCSVLLELHEAGQNVAEQCYYAHKLYVENSVDLTITELHNYAQAYKRVVSQLRDAIGMMPMFSTTSSSSNKKKNRSNNHNSSSSSAEKAAATTTLTKAQRAAHTAYLSHLQSQLQAVLDEVSTTLESYVIPAASGAEGRCFSLRAQGDILRYRIDLARSRGENIKVNDTSPGKATAIASATASASKQDERVSSAIDTYEHAKKYSEELPSTNTTRLGLMLNYSTFQADVLRKKPEACATARAAFDDAIADLDTLNEEDYRESTMVMQLLRDNLLLWTSSSSTEDDDSVEDDEDNDEFENHEDNEANY